MTGIIFVLLLSGLWRPMKTIWKRTFTMNSSSFTNYWKLIWENRLSNNTNLPSP